MWVGLMLALIILHWKFSLPKQCQWRRGAGLSFVQVKVPDSCLWRFPFGLFRVCVCVACSEALSYKGFLCFWASSAQMSFPNKTERWQPPPQRGQFGATKKKATKATNFAIIGLYLSCALKRAIIKLVVPISRQPNSWNFGHITITIYPALIQWKSKYYYLLICVWSKRVTHFACLLQ